jgi:hypothetical protein
MAGVGQNRNTYRVLILKKTLREKDYVENVWVEWRIILKLML